MRYKKSLKKVTLKIILPVFLFIFAGLILWSKQAPNKSPLNYSTSLTTQSITNAASPSRKLKISSPSAQPAPQTTQATTAAQNFGRSIRIPILTYHYIGANPNPGKDPARDNLSVVPDLFDSQMNYLVQNGFTSISLDTMIAALKGQIHLPAKPVVITFDDGYIDFYVNAYPILRKHGLRATSFVPTGLIGTGFYMSWDQIKEMHSSGLVSFQAHTVNHSDLTTIPTKQAMLEVLQSKKELESRLGVPVNFLAYPYGTSNASTWKMIQEAGYAGAVGTWLGINVDEGNIYNMPRIKIGGGTKVEDFAKKL